MTYVLERLIERYEYDKKVEETRWFFFDKESALRFGVDIANADVNEAVEEYEEEPKYVPKPFWNCTVLIDRKISEQWDKYLSYGEFEYFIRIVEES